MRNRTENANRQQQQKRNCFSVLNADPKSPKSIMGPSNTRKVIEIIPISFKLSIGEFNSERKTKTFPNYSPFEIQRGNSRMFNQKTTNYPRKLHLVTRSQRLFSITINSRWRTSQMMVCTSPESPKKNVYGRMQK